MLRTFVIVCIGYVFDVAPSFRQAMWTFGMMVFGQSPIVGIQSVLHLGLSREEYVILVLGTILILVVSIFNEKSTQSLRKRIDNKPVAFECIITVIGLLVVLTFGVYGPGYNAADFVYAQF